MMTTRTLAHAGWGAFRRWRLTGAELAALVLGLAAAVGALPRVGAFPPAPHHLLHGIVRDAFGTPIGGEGASIVLETPTGVKVRGEIIPGIEPGLNYRLIVPMDSGMTADRYKPTALQPAAAFRIWVGLGTTTNLPIEMSGDFARLGQPGQVTRLDLTLGEDANHDGLPDAWQRLIDADLSKVKPTSTNQFGMTYMQAYYTGVYAYDSPQGFALEIAGMTNGLPVLEFMGVQGRCYAIQGSSDLVTWTPVEFRIRGDAANAPLRARYVAGRVQKLQVEVPLGDPAPAKLGAYRLMLVQ
jgi:hypothetical protein